MSVQNDKLMLLVGTLNYTWTNTESLLIYLMSHLMRTSKETAIVTFLTLNTTRARLELIDRLAKLSTTPAPTRDAVLDITRRMKGASRLRNKFNHCIYLFDEHGDLESTQLLRIAEFGEDVKYGKVENLDDEEIARIKATISEVGAINRSIWQFLNTRQAA